MNHAVLKPLSNTPVEPCMRVLLPYPLGSAYDYRFDERLTRGALVVAPLGPRDCIGVVWGEADGTIARERVKRAEPLPGAPCLPQSLCDFIDWTAGYTLSPAGLVLAMALRVRDAFEAERPRIGYARGAATPARMTQARARVLALAEDGLARSIASWAEEANVTPAVVRGLIDCAALEEVALPEFVALAAPDPDCAPAELNAEQDHAARELRACVAANEFSVTLLDGVTGSGKTETYFEAVAEALRHGKQVLILLPEIALTVQFLDRFAQRFGCRPAEWHSDLSPKERRRVWRAVLSGEARVVVGARSALFLPFAALGLVIVDEEHEQAYKQEEGVVYHARDMAVVRARLENASIVLASATPSLETTVNAESGRYHWLKLPRRHGRAVLPQIRLIDLRAARSEAGTWLSQPLREALGVTLASGEQAMLFLNRRGYAPLTLCEACGHKMICKQCSAWLVEHRYQRKLACHHCGFEMPAPLLCPECKGEKTLVACGPGVERVAEEFAGVFPDARVAIASSDTLHGPLETQAAIRAMAKRETQVLIGTQIVAKGHHFPQLTLVGVIDADLGGSDGDLRARERTFQLLHQVAGRAGRAEKPGLVLIQTRNPDDPVMRALAGGDRDAFYAQEIAARKRVSAPPFGRLAAIILASHDGQAVRETGRALARAAPNAHGVKIWGPTPAFYQLLRGRSRERLLVQAEKSVDVQAYLRTWLARLKIPGAVRVTVDIDPVSFF
ncbi:MAG TPA: primosomal protein N' [Rhizomicrobium sp.]|jgi:primosomal protein N' (replication factor Y)|nr:primosomal protein N' [Rhizomicrobium sp.]